MHRVRVIAFTILTPFYFLKAGIPIKQAGSTASLLAVLLFGLTNHIIDKRQQTILLTAVVASAVVPTIIAERWFQPAFRALRAATPAKPESAVTAEGDI